MLKSTNKENIFLFNTDIVLSPIDRVQPRAKKTMPKSQNQGIECFNLKECLNAMENFRDTLKIVFVFFSPHGILGHYRTASHLSQSELLLP